ncbi:hypothetical protein HMPREF1553_01064 [Porphyromonas gingivalis F0568]|nr:hypothetical protein HMPREF1553_01064 [Porphyromonas gingivalis F0568]
MSKATLITNEGEALESSSPFYCQKLTFRTRLPLTEYIVA